MNRTINTKNCIVRFAVSAAFAVAAIVLQCSDAPRYTRVSLQSSTAAADYNSPSRVSGKKKGSTAAKKSRCRKDLVDSYYQRGKASFYGRKFSGRKTASGERHNPNDFTAAHRTLPFGTKVRVTNFNNGKSVVVRVNDRGPWGDKKRVVDLSRAAAKAIGMISEGVVPVGIELIK